MTAHDKSVHVDKGPQICINCSYDFVTSYELKKHSKNCTLDLSFNDNPLKHIVEHKDGGNRMVGGAGVPQDLGSDNPTLAMLNTTTVENDFVVSHLDFSALALYADLPNQEIEEHEKKREN